MAADPALLKHILANLVNNAVQAMPQVEKLDEYASRDVTFLSLFRTLGRAFSEDVRPKLFTPSFTTKSKGRALTGKR